MFGFAANLTCSAGRLRLPVTTPGFEDISNGMASSVSCTRHVVTHDDSVGSLWGK